ncbi:MAG: aldo/keto reductase [FCB group bacterium]|jgi:aryl-alcohol dehydrogenase-like predicted oxidoreductase|nr:aldo/keto reductase [FCB group bacterium]
MNYVYFGKTGLRVSELCLGTMTFGKEADEQASVAIMDRALDAGINFFDTANIYNKGVTEEILGRYMGTRREGIVLASKVHFPTGDGINDRGSSRRHIVLSVEESLKRLRTDRLDILYLHHWDENTAIEESLTALNLLVNQGKVLYVGVSNFAAWQIVKALAAAERRGFAPVSVIQPMYNLLKRQAEVEILPMALSEGLAVCPYSPMGGGYLSGKYQAGESGRMTTNAMYQSRYGDPVYRDIGDRFVAYAREHGYAPAALAVAWVLNHPAITAPIVGARSVAQFNETLACLDIRLTPEQRNEVGALSIEPPPATDRSEKAALT